MIREHHRIIPYRINPHWLVERFRKADWVDVSMGLITFGLSRTFLAEVSSGVAQRRLPQAARPFVAEMPANTPVESSAHDETVVKMRFPQAYRFERQLRGGGVSRAFVGTASSRAMLPDK